MVSDKTNLFLKTILIYTFFLLIIAHKINFLYGFS